MLRRELVQSAVAVDNTQFTTSNKCLSGWFPFFSATNITKLERLHRVVSRAITGCFSFSSIPLLLSEVSLPPLRFTPTHFTFSSYERGLRFPTSFFRFDQTWSETKTLQIFRESLCVHSPDHASFYFS